MVNGSWPMAQSPWLMPQGSWLNAHGQEKSVPQARALAPYFSWPLERSVGGSAGENISDVLAFVFELLAFFGSLMA